MPQHVQPGRPKPQAGFTLIEVIAVIAIIGMVFAIGIPNLGGNKWNALNNEAELIAQSLRFARQRAVMTGIPHRVLIDLEDGGYLLTLDPGDYVVCEVQQTDWTQSAPSGAAADGTCYTGAGSSLAAPAIGRRSRSRRTRR